MKANIVSSEKQTLPRFNPQTNQDEPTIMVVTTVDFVNDEGVVVHTQSYAQLPQDVEADYFQRQADVMQQELDLAKEQAAVQAASELADQKAAELNALAVPNNSPQPDVQN